MNQQCKEVEAENFICQTNANKLSNPLPCEVQLLRYSENFENCLQINAHIHRLKIQSIENGKWIVITRQTEPLPPNSAMETKKTSHLMDLTSLNYQLTAELKWAIKSLERIRTQRSIILNFWKSLQ